MIFKNYSKVKHLEEDEHFDYSNLYIKETIEDEEFLDILLQIDKIKKSQYPFMIKNKILEALRSFLKN